MQLAHTSNIPYHTIAAEFVTRLPPRDYGYVVLLTQTDMADKRPFLSVGETRTASEWTATWLESMRRLDWSLAAAFMSHQNHGE